VNAIDVYCRPPPRSPASPSGNPAALQRPSAPPAHAAPAGNCSIDVSPLHLLLTKWSLRTRRLDSVSELLAKRWSRSKSAASCGGGLLASGACGCVTRVSTRRSISRDRRCCGHICWHRTGVRRSASGVATGAQTSMPTGAVPGSSSPCSPSGSGLSRPRTAPKLGSGNLNAFVKPLGRARAEPVRGRWCGRGASPTAW
jgi:hypothetical protein